LQREPCGCDKTSALLASFNYPSSDHLLILGNIDNSESLAGIDAIICMGA
jgi:hypothetical protein